MIQEIIKESIKDPNEKISFTNNMAKYLSENQIIIIPLLLLIIIYSLKYFFGNNFNKKSFLEFALEFPVDFGFIGITFVFTYYFIDIKNAVFGGLMILICIFVAIINSTFRRLAITEYYKDSSNNYILGIYGIFNSSLSVLFVYFILNSIQNS
jgi:hypothetical protein